jgi:GNAT superfamily N-acetyltransferase
MAEPTVPGVVGAVGADGVIDAVPPGIPGPRRVVEVVTHYLEMRAAPGGVVPAPPAGVQLVRAVPSAGLVRFYRFLYDSVGGPWHWYARQVMPREELAAILADPGVEVYVLWLGGVPLGYAELDRRVAGEVELAYFGLLPEAVGQGLGSWMLAWSIAEAWRPPGVERVWVHTCSLDHEAALPVYLRAGFTKTGESRHRQTIVETTSPDSAP